MNSQIQNAFIDLGKILSNEINLINDFENLFKNLNVIKNSQEKEMVLSQINSLKESLKKENFNFETALNKISLPKPLNQKDTFSNSTNNINMPSQKKVSLTDLKLTSLEKSTLKRLKKKDEKLIQDIERKPNRYIQLSNNLFSNTSKSLLKQEQFKVLKSNLIKANLHFLPRSYISVILFTTLLATFISIFLFIFFLFFNLSPLIPFIILVEEDLFARFLKIFWIIFAVPITTFITMYTYPALEQKSTGSRIDQELPFATINMAAISGSMIDPSNIFSIIISTKEYPYLEKEFKKLLNEVNLLGYDLVTALRHSATNCPSKKLTELFNGVATTINSGGNLAEFFNKRAETLLFEYRIEKEKRTRSAETFMDIYISVVIAAPMILMLLLMMMKISGLGIQLSTSMIALVMVLGVSGINIGFLTFLHLKQSASGE